jgi:hypothetical protein
MKSKRSPFLLHNFLGLDYHLTVQKSSFEVCRSSESSTEVLRIFFNACSPAPRSQNSARNVGNLMQCSLIAYLFKFGPEERQVVYETVYLEEFCIASSGFVCACSACQYR